MKTDLSNQADRDCLRTLRDWIRWCASRFEEAQLVYGHGTDNSLDEAAALVLHAVHLDHRMPPHYIDAALTPSEQDAVLALIKRRIEDRKPLAYLMGEAWFAGLKFIVDERVLVPRSPIAELINQEFEPWFDEAEPESILDLCTGSGCIAIACAQVFPEADIIATDLSADALEVATQNVARYELETRVTLIQSDLYDKVTGQFDLIVSNPPYVDASDMTALSAEFKHEPKLGLEAGQDGLSLVATILEKARDYLKPGGVLVVEVGNSAEALVDHYPELPLIWPEFQQGGQGVFMISQEDLVAWSAN